MSVTLFTIPKRFAGDNAIRQRNAIGSWRQAFPGCQILLFGDDAGVAEAAAELGVEHVPGIECNEFGTPYLDWAFATARLQARHDTLAYVNADIIFLPDTAHTLAPAIEQGCFIVGQRFNVDLCAPLDFTEDWAGFLRRNVMPTGQWGPLEGLDYFIFPKDTFPDFPRFVVGRPFWDTWMLGQANQRGLRTVNATAAITVLHQNHDYTHVRRATGPQWQGPEGDYNQSLLGPITHELGNADATQFHLTANGSLVPHAMPTPALTRTTFALLVAYHRTKLKNRPDTALQVRVWLACLFARGWERFPRLCAPGRPRQALLRWLLRP